MNAREESDKILSLCDGDVLKALGVLERQLNVLHTRAQVLLSLAGVVITVTGFSGRTIAGTGAAGQFLVVAGLATVLSSAIWMFARVMGIRWVTSELSAEASEALRLIVERRNRKARAYAIGGRILCAGFLLYCAAVAIMLLNP
jgi:hypothetical protein